MGHFWFLSTNRPFQHDRKSFNGIEKHRTTPKQLSREEVLDQLDKLKHISLGKKSKAKMSAKRQQENITIENNWKKKIIFFQFPYWKTLFLHYNMDVMHIEKIYMWQYRWHPIEYWRENIGQLE